MKKTTVLFLLSLACAIFAALAFVNNVAVVIRWWQAFLASGGNTAGIPARVPGLLPWLDWSAVDYSAVTTLIPLIGFSSLTLAAGRLLRRHPVPAANFPFFAGSDQLHVALGLFGTLWGIIVIGYFRLDTVTMADLMKCLHTALFSTLMAVVWVFLLDRPLLRPLFRRLLTESGLALSEEGDLAGAVDRLILRLDAASAAFDARQRQFEAAFEKRQREYDEFFQREIAELRARADRADARAEAANGKLAAVTAALKA